MHLLNVLLQRHTKWKDIDTTMKQDARDSQHKVEKKNTNKTNRSLIKSTK